MAAAAQPRTDARFADGARRQHPVTVTAPARTRGNAVIHEASSARLSPASGRGLAEPGRLREGAKYYGKRLDVWNGAQDRIDL